MTNPSRAFERAQRRIPGGVDSPVRAFRAVGGTPAPMPPAPLQSVAQARRPT